MLCKGLAANKQADKLTTLEFNLPDIKSNEVIVSVSHCGICHSDLHLINNDWGISSYPMIPGHEIIGTVEKIGSDVKNLEKGQRVGIGWISKSCFECDNCKKGLDNLCQNQQPTCVGKFGGFSEAVICDSRLAFKIPDNIESKDAAPLLCAGITTYAPFINHNVKKGDSVGIVGLGGLGHIAVQFANKMGCDVTVFSHSTNKKEMAFKLGAKHFVETSNINDMTAAANSQDFILNTVSDNIDYDSLINCLKTNGTLCVVGVSSNPIKILPFTLISKQIKLAGSAVGNIATIKNMLEFCSKHNVRPWVEEFEMTEANTAIQNLKDNKLKFRAVLKNNLKTI